MRGFNLMAGLLREARRALFYRNPPDHSGLRERVLAAPEAEWAGLIGDALCERLSWRVCVRRSRLSPRTKFTDLRMAWSHPGMLQRELRPWVKEGLGFGNIWPAEFIDRETIGDLAGYLAQELQSMIRPEGTLEDTHPNLGFWAPAFAYEGEKVQEQAVFVVASARSGTTLLRIMLSGHEEIFSPPELHLLQFDRMGDRKRSLIESRRMWMRTGVFQAFEQAGGIKKREAVRLVKELEERNTPVAEVYRRLHRLAGKELFVDKSPSYVINKMWLGRAEDMFVDPKYIYLSRHPYSVMESFVRMRLGRLEPVGGASRHRHPWLNAEDYWAQCNRNILDLGRTIPAERWCHVRYEDLVTDTEGVHRGISSFLGIDFEEALLDPYGDDRPLGGAGDRNLADRGKVDPGRIDAWRANPPPHRLRDFSRSVAKELNYEIPD